MRIAGQKAIRPKAYATTPYVLKHDLITENGGDYSDRLLASHGGCIAADVAQGPDELFSECPRWGTHLAHWT